MATGFTKEIEKVENYKKAKLDNFLGWNIHHRLETHTSEGIKRLVQITKEELIALDMYFDRPANELIYLTIPEHTSVHSKGRKCSEEQKRKTSKTLMGHKVTEETRKKISEKLMGSHLTEECKKKISLKLKGGNKTSFKKGHKSTPEAIAKQVISSKKQMAIKKKLFENYKDEMTWNQFQTFYRTHKYLFENNFSEGGNGKTESHNEN